MAEDPNNTGDKPQLPQKKFFRSRAHCNPLSHNDAFDYPVTPDGKDWACHYPQRAEAKTLSQVEIADVGCGYGGLLIGLSPLFPDTLMCGFEIRVKLVEYVHLRIEALRAEHPGKFTNVSVLRTNAMKYLPNYFKKGQLSKMFFCFPDPHFKKQNFRRRIISRALLSEYAYALREGGRLYTITDVKDLADWMAKHSSEHPLFERLSEEEVSADPAVEVMRNSTEEGHKVTREGRSKWVSVFRRLPDAAAEVAPSDFWGPSADQE